MTAPGTTGTRRIRPSRSRVSDLRDSGSSRRARRDRTCRRRSGRGRARFRRGSRAAAARCRSRPAPIRRSRRRRRASGSNRIAVQPVGRRVSVQWPTRRPGTSVSDPVSAGREADCAWSTPRATAAPAIVEAKSRRVSFIARVYRPAYSARTFDYWYDNSNGRPGRRYVRWTKKRL